MKFSFFLTALILMTVTIFTSCQTTINLTSKNEISFIDNFGEKQSFLPIEEIKPCPYNKKNIKTRGHKKSYVKDSAYTFRLGVDISRHDGQVDWKKLKADGRDFVILRVGYRGYQSGTLKVDENFHANIKGALEAGFDVGVYVFSQALNEEETLEEAELVLREIAPYQITLPVVFDPEYISWEEARTDDVKGDVFTKNAITFCERIKEAGYTPMIYSNLSWQAFVFDLSQLSEYKMWYADYKKIPRTPYDFEFWQYSCFGKVKGVNRKCDLDMWIIPANQ